MKMMGVLAISLLLLFWCTCVGSEEEVWFPGGSQHLLAKENTDIFLPCKPNSTARAVISWSWNGRLITAGTTLVYEEPRITIIEKGKELHISRVQINDSGEYSCTYNLKSKPISVTHRLDVLVAPTARIISKSNHLTREEGDRLVLRCQVNGYPTPTVRWYFKGSGELLIEDDIYTVNSLSRDQSGDYECKAVNSEGTATDFVVLDVQYKPKATIEKKNAIAIRQKTESREIIFSCHVDANPRAMVSWFKNGMVVDRDDPKDLYREKFQDYRQTGKKKTYFLKIKSMMESDYGNYSCVATNSLGSSTSSYHLTGSPDQPAIISPGYGNERERYTLVWKVWTPPSFPILNQSILYRKVGKAEGGTITDREGTWHNLALISEDEKLIKESYSMDLNGLDSDCEYEVRIRSMNSQGWSPLSNVFVFKTTGRVYQPLSSIYQEGQLKSSSSNLQNHHFPLLPLLILLFCIK